MTKIDSSNRNWIADTEISLSPWFQNISLALPDLSCTMGLWLIKRHILTRCGGWWWHWHIHQQNSTINTYKQSFPIYMCLVWFFFSVDCPCRISPSTKRHKGASKLLDLPKVWRGGRNAWCACSEWLRDLSFKFYDFFLDLSSIGPASSEYQTISRGNWFQSLFARIAPFSIFAVDWGGFCHSPQLAMALTGGTGYQQAWPCYVMLGAL